MLFYLSYLNFKLYFIAGRYAVLADEWNRRLYPPCRIHRAGAEPPYGEPAPLIESKSTSIAATRLYDNLAHASRFRGLLDLLNERGNDALGPF